MIDKTSKIIIFVLITFILVGSVLAGVVYFPSINSKANPLTSQTLKSPGCDSPIMYGRIDGIMEVSDEAILGVRPYIVSLKINSIETVSGGSLSVIGRPYGVFSEDYTYRVELVDAVTGNIKPNPSIGSGTHPGGDEVIQRKSFSLYFGLPDSDCNGKFDEAQFKVIATLTPENTPEKIKELTINLESGGSWGEI